MSKHTRQDVIRMAGHLLLHHPTTRQTARINRKTPTSWDHPEADCWCLHGALEACGDKLGTRPNFDVVWWPSTWDHATDEERRAYAQRMTRYVEGEVLT